MCFLVRKHGYTHPPSIISNPLLLPPKCQVQVLREFLSEYEQEASGGCASGTSGGVGPLGVIRGNSARGSRGNGLHGDTEDAGKGDKKGASGGIGGPGGANGGGGDAGGSGTGGSEIYSRGRDWVRHELCGMLVSNLFSSKTLREKLSKKPIGGILVGLLCGPPVRSSNNNNRLADSTLLPVSSIFPPPRSQTIGAVMAKKAETS